MPAITTLAYKPTFKDVLPRLRSLYGRTAGDRLLATMDVPNAALAQFAQSHAAAGCSDPDLAERTRFWDDFLSHRAAVEDDSMPVAYLSELDQGLCGGLLGAEVQFTVDPTTGWISSMVPPLLKDWSEFDRLRFDPEHPWWRRYVRQLEVFAAASCGKWGIGHFILIDGLHFVFELIGATQTYLSLDEYPNMVRRAVDFAFDVNVRIQEQFFATVPALEGGTLSHFAQWLPGRIVTESLDAFHMTSVAYFERWGREPAERIMNRFDGGVTHLHANGRHLLEAAATLGGLVALRLMDDRGFPTSFDIVEQLKARAGGVPLILRAPYESFADRLRRHTLPGGVLYQVQSVPTVDAANRLMEEVRAYVA
jgi:hypothetical protein